MASYVICTCFVLVLQDSHFLHYHLVMCVTEPPMKIIMTKQFEAVDEIYSSVCDQ